MIEANAVQVLAFLIHFMDAELLPRLAPPVDGQIARDLVYIREGLDEIRGYVSARAPSSACWPRPDGTSGLADGGCPVGVARDARRALGAQAAALGTRVFSLRRPASKSSMLWTVASMIWPTAVWVK